jgi:hypothetical protein
MTLSPEVGTVHRRSKSEREVQCVEFRLVLALATSVLVFIFCACILTKILTSSPSAVLCGESSVMKARLRTHTTTIASRV